MANKLFIKITVREATHMVYLCMLAQYFLHFGGIFKQKGIQMFPTPQNKYHSDKTELAIQCRNKFC